MIRTTLHRLAAATLLAGVGTVAVSAAPAAAADDCKTVVTNVVNRPDNGHGTGGSPQPGYWADVTLTRTVKICRVPDKAAADAKTVPVPTWTYHATVVDDGTLVTRGGPTLSPNAGIALAAGVKGTVKGFFEVDFTAPADWQFFNKAKLHGKTVTGDPKASPADGNPTTTEWVPSLWSAGFVGTGSPSGFNGKTWEWRYKTCNESWWDAADPASADGTTDAAGDITGAKPCPAPSASASVSVSASPSVSASAPPVVDTPPAAGGGLPVTGPPVGVLVGVGAAAVLAGVALLLFVMRRRRVAFEA